MDKYIIREVQDPEFSFFFDTDAYSKNTGDYGNTVFCVTSHYCNYSSGINSKDFEEITRELDEIISEIDNIGYYYQTVKEIMKDYNIPYSPRSAHALKGLIEIDNYIEQLCAYLTIKTGKAWTTRTCRGYCQGDYVEVVYCEKFYTDHEIDIIGDMYLGCGKEFSIEFPDNETVYGYFVADCQGYTEADYLSIICEQEGIEKEKAILETIDHIETVYNPVYKTYTEQEYIEEVA